MPWKSKAQARYMHMLANEGKVKLNTHEWDKATEEDGGFKNLPEHVNDMKPKKKSKRASSTDNLDAIVQGILDKIKLKEKI
jgi:uncharacterized protein YjhX (UPF0386 family)